MTLLSPDGVPYRHGTIDLSTREIGRMFGFTENEVREYSMLVTVSVSIAVPPDSPLEEAIYGRKRYAGGTMRSAEPQTAAKQLGDWFRKRMRTGQR